jgi:hypothetical protein
MLSRIVMLAALFIGCGRAPANDQSGIAIHSAAETVVAGSGPVALSVTVSNPSGTINWVLSGPGSLSAESGSSISYFPPSCVLKTKQALITASTGPTSATLTLSIVAAAATVSCLEISASANETTVGGPPVTLTAIATGDVSAVTWSVFGGGSLSVSTGATTQFTPSPTMPVDATVTVTAALGELRAYAGIVVHPRPRYFVGRCPSAITFDGTNLWVVNQLNGPTTPSNVMKLRPEDGTILATVPVENPRNLVFDGSNIWVSSLHYPYLGSIAADMSFVKIRASDATKLGTFSVWYAPSNASASSVLAFDGANIWAVVYDGVAKFRTSDATVESVYSAAGASAVVWDGASAWLGAAGILTHLRADVTVQGRIVTSYGASLMTVTGGDVFAVLNNPSGPWGLVQIDPQREVVLNSHPIAAITALALKSDGASLWVATYFYPDMKVRKLSLPDVSIQAEYPLPAPPTALTFDGTHMWVATCGFANADDAVFKL